jgi:CRP-like cAMP-binding protein
MMPFVDTTEALRRLAAAPAFSDCTRGELEELLEACELESAAPGRAFVKEGAAGDSAYVILDGRAEVTKIGASGGSHRLDDVEAGDLLGEVGLLTPHPRSATVTALDEVTYLRLPRERFQQLLDRHSVAARKLLTHVAISMAERMRHMNDRFVEMLEHEHVRAGPPDFEQLRSRLRQALVRHV